MLIIIYLLFLNQIYSINLNMTNNLVLYKTTEIYCLVGH